MVNPFWYHLPWSGLQVREVLIRVRRIVLLLRYVALARTPLLARLARLALHLERGSVLPRALDVLTVPIPLAPSFLRNYLMDEMISHLNSSRNRSLGKYSMKSDLRETHLWNK